MNYLTASTEIVSDLTEILESENSVAIDWFTKKKIIVSTDKFQVIFLDKKKPDHSKKQLLVNDP